MRVGDWARLPPLFFGRISRALLGLASLAIVVILGPQMLGLATTGILVFLGVSFLVGGLMGNAGCELTALPNLVLPRDKRVHFL